MSKKAHLKQEKASILAHIAEIGEPMSLGEIENILPLAINKKTLQRRIWSMVEEGFLLSSGERSHTKYYADKDINGLKSVSMDQAENTSGKNLKTKSEDKDKHLIFSSDAMSLLGYLNTPSYARKRSSYQFSLVDNYIPNQTQYVPKAMRVRLYETGKRFNEQLAAGTYAKRISHRLLIDLSYNSSRLEGNTYSKLDTQKLIEQGLTAEGKVHKETVMIMNHKEAIEFLIENAEEIVLIPFIIRNIHSLLSQDLLANPKACGKIREIEVGISQSAYMPLSNSHQLDEYLSLILRKADKIEDPFEKSFFLLLHLSYLQAFEDVNKRTARLSCNISFIQHNLCPMSFIDVPQEDYFKSLLYFYETNQIEPALELFEWAYLRSCDQYGVVTESLGEIDTYRIQHRADRKIAMGHIIRQKLDDAAVNQYLEQYCRDNNIPSEDKFISMTLSDLAQLHEGSIIGLGITEKIFIEWKNAN
jgi:prophage maintenance system killer protein